MKNSRPRARAFLFAFWALAAVGLSDSARAEPGAKGAVCGEWTVREPSRLDVSAQGISKVVERRESFCLDVASAQAFSVSCSIAPGCDAARKALKLDSEKFQPRGDLGNPDFALCEAIGTRAMALEVKVSSGQWLRVIRCLSPVDGSFIGPDWVSDRLRVRGRR